MTRWTGSDQVAIVGVGNTDFGALYREKGVQRSEYDLAASAFKAALEDSTLDKEDIDGLLTCRVSGYQKMATMLGIRRPRLINNFGAAGRMSAVAVQAAIAAILTGQAETVALVYGNNGRSVGATYGGGDPKEPAGEFDARYGMTSPGAYAGLMYQRYQELNKVPDGALSTLAINNRNHAKLNPYAVMSKPLTEDEYMASRYIAEPLRLYDYCLINDGSVALILTTVEKARTLNRPLVTISATAAAADIGAYYSSPDFYYEACRQVADDVYQQAGISQSDIDCVQIYDNFTPTIFFSLEGFGFCPQGTAWDWVRDGRIGLGGELPTNTSGGHTSESYMQGWGLHAEAVRQLRGEAGERQVANCETVQYICASPITTSHILRRH